MMNPGDEAYGRTLHGRTHNRTLRNNMKANKAKALQPINSYPEFEPSRAIKQSHTGHHRTHDEPRR